MNEWAHPSVVACISFSFLFNKRTEFREIISDISQAFYVSTHTLAHIQTHISHMYKSSEDIIQLKASQAAKVLR